MLRDDVVTLGPISREDGPRLFGWINDAPTVRFNAPYAPVHEANHLAWLDGLTKDRSRHVFAIRRVEDGELLGTVQLFDLHPVHRSAELAIRIGDVDQRGRGYGSRAVRLAIDFAFRDRNLNRVWLTVFADNPCAVRAYEKAGLTVEGRLRNAYYIDGGWVDGLMMSRLASDPVAGAPNT